MKDSIKYNHWKTGNEIERPPYNSEQRTTLICPLDKTPLIKYNEEMIEGLECPNCGITILRQGILNMMLKTTQEIISEK